MMALIEHFIACETQPSEYPRDSSLWRAINLNQKSVSPYGTPNKVSDNLSEPNPETVPDKTSDDIPASSVTCTERTSTHPE